MALLSNFMMPRGGVSGPDPFGGPMTNMTREGGDGRDGGGGGGAASEVPPTSPTEPPPETPPESPTLPTLPGELPGGPGPAEPTQPAPVATPSLPMGPGVIGMPGSQATAPGRTGQFFENRFVGGAAPDEMLRRRQGPGVPGQPGNVVPTGTGGMPTEDMLRNIVERMRRRPQVR